ncbi:MAG: SRPBCC family protein [Bacteroidota bacterium]
MEIRQETIINKSIADCWEILGNQYVDIYKWASPVNHAEGDGKSGLNGAACDIRGCHVSGMGDIKEKLTDFDPENHYLAYEVITGLPAMMKAAKNSWKLSAINAEQTRLNMAGVIQPKGILGSLLKPVLKMQFDKMTKNIVEEFKHYVETGEQHPRKVKAAQKYAA